MQYNTGCRKFRATVTDTDHRGSAKSALFTSGVEPRLIDDDVYDIDRGPARSDAPLLDQFCAAKTYQRIPK